MVATGVMKGPKTTEYLIYIECCENARCKTERNKCPIATGERAVANEDREQEGPSPR